MLIRFEQSSVAALRNEQLDLRRRMNVMVAPGAGPEQPDDERRRSVEHDDEWPEHLQRPAHGPDRSEGDFGGMLERERLGDQLPEHDLHRAQPHQNHALRDGFRAAGIQREPRVECAGQ